MNLATIVERLSPAQIDEFWTKIDKKGEDDCWLWKLALYGENDRYGAVRLFYTTCRAHIIAFIIINGFQPEVVMHSCDNPPCCNPKHLVAGTHEKNLADSIAKGRKKNSGTGNPFSAFTNKNILDIQELYAMGVKQKDIAAKYGVHRSTIRRLINNETYK